MPEKMNLVIKDVILEKWKSKIGYSFNFKDLEELEITINQFDSHIKYLENKLQQKEDTINKAKDYINTTEYSDIVGLNSNSIKDFWFVKELLEILKEVE